METSGFYKLDGTDFLHGKNYVINAVSIHAPARGATSIDTPKTDIDGSFQSTRPHGARRPAPALAPPLLTLFQSTRPHGARQLCSPQEIGGRRVSIHAPARGATRAQLLFPLLRRVSIHAPARGATALRCGNGVRVAAFQSTRPHGARHKGQRAVEHLRQFQSTRPHGARLCGWQMPNADRRGFNPRARTGRDLLRDALSHWSNGFNPRARTGRDPVILPTRITTPISTPNAITPHDLIINATNTTQFLKFLMITRCWRRANRLGTARSL